MIAVAHLPAALSIAISVALAVLILWYWKRLGADDVPESRRRIRRASMVVMLVGLPILVRALSFVDFKTQQVQYVVCWLLVLFCLALILLAAAMDVFDTLRLSRQERRRNFLDAHAAAAHAREAPKKEEGDET
jgi:UDP-N-acetylmuramyl pentapeptide phosphotransferase/UDP-N-acetylglucosamine-1-phosphate transferase